MNSADPVRELYDNIEGRGAADYLLRNTHQQLVALSSQADLKANILITVTSILLSVAITRVGDPDLRPALITVMVFLFAALLAAAAAVVPKLTRRGRVLSEPPPGFDPLFFGHFGAIPKERYLEEMAVVLHDDASVYHTLVSNLHNQGAYLLYAKYRFLGLAYVVFLSGFVAGAIAYAISAAI